MPFYIARRLAWTVVVVLVVLMIVFAIFFLLPSGKQGVLNFVGKQPTTTSWQPVLLSSADGRPINEIFARAHGRRDSTHP